MDAQLNCLAFDDDYYMDDPCGPWVSYLENVPLAGGEAYYILVDGYGGDCGAYQIAVYESVVATLATSWSAIKALHR